MGFAQRMGEAVAFMGDGVVVKAGDPREEPTKPRHDRTKAFLPKVL
ncbi:hypothetical protein [Streptomyces sp. RPT161]